ncbi:unnamed protein product [Protopolystoma xenopodis]|uniref:Nucleoporin Nup120/160 beta-propeller domain-containing protein n=1 Tax=Protopolystoma xenopodis TaxID=117903 RepID=A0A448WCV3_9PLAT|nr:unnamed protein product [Protopolystoma xenopodis]
MSEVGYPGFEASGNSGSPKFSHGICHRVRLLNSHSQAYPLNDLRLLVFLSLTPINESINGVPNLWIWLRFDLTRALARDRECLEIITVQVVSDLDSIVGASPHPLPSIVSTLIDSEEEGTNEEAEEYQICNPQRLGNFSNSDVNLLDFLPMKLTSVDLCLKLQSDHDIALDGDDVDVSSEVMDYPHSVSNSHLPSDHRHLSKPTFLTGIWWLGCQSRSQFAGDLQNHFCLRWTSFPSHMKGDSFEALALPPGFGICEEVSSWQRHPPSALLDSRGPNMEDYCLNLTPFDSNSVEIAASFEQHTFALLDFVFRPGRFSRIAIYNAFKILRRTYRLSPDVFALGYNVNELRAEISRTMETEIRPRINASEVNSMLSSFYSSILDFHAEAIQPLGLFAISSFFMSAANPGLSGPVSCLSNFPSHCITSLDEGTLPLSCPSSISISSMVPMTAGIIVVRRYGFSVLRPLLPFEQAICSPESFPLHHFNQGWCF